MRITNLVVTVGALAIFGCSSGSSGGGGGGNDGSCNATTVFSEGAAAGNSCASCMESSCNSQVSSYQSGCSDYISCVCSASGNTSSIESCESKIEESSCETAAQALGTCANANCHTQCNTSDGG